MDLICFSHLRWNFVYQRPQHLLTRFSNHYRVFYVEEPVTDAQKDGYYITLSKENVWIVTPHLQADAEVHNHEARHKSILNDFFTDHELNEYIFWYYAPMALPVTEHFKPVLTVYDCMDELSAFKFAPPTITEVEKELFKKAQLVFTGGYSLYLSKKNKHHNIHCFASSIDKEHFATARLQTTDPHDQAHIPHPRLGYYGVIDERFDIDLVREVALQKPDWHFILVGPTVKIDPATLPRFHNIHYLESKTYQQLPSYLSGWDIAIVPFAINESTRFISPTKTPEYLAAGKPVISTPIQDVVNPYGNNNLVHIAYSPQQFIQQAEQELSISKRNDWLKKVDGFLANNSWNNTWSQMNELLNKALAVNRKSITNKKEVYV
ncbi:glycosyltransferase family 1 protein [soil metagenome]